MLTVSPLIGKDVERNDKTSVEVLLGFFLGQCTNKGPGEDLVIQRQLESELLSRTLRAVLPICNAPSTKSDVEE
jgi:hypothetical protein